MIIGTYLPPILMVLSVLCHPLLQEVPAMMELTISAFGRKYHLECSGKIKGLIRRQKS
jgi:hypothetical protein